MPKKIEIPTPSNDNADTPELDPNLPPEISEGFKHNFEQLYRAFANDDTCIVSVFERDEFGAVTDKTAVLLCAVNRIDEQNSAFVPIARMIDGNPYAQYAMSRDAPRVDDTGEPIEPTELN